MANIDYELDKIYSHLGDKSLSTVRELLFWVNVGGNTHPKCDYLYSMGLCPRSNKKGES